MYNNVINSIFYKTNGVCYLENNLVSSIISPINNVCVIIVMALLISHSTFFRQLLDGKRSYTNQFLLLITFGVFSLYAAAVGNESNVRVLGPMLAGLLGGPITGVGAGLFGGFYRFFDLRYAGAAEMAYSALLATLLAGLAGGLVNIRNKGQLPSVWGAACFALAYEIFHMLLTVVVGQEEIVIASVKKVCAPMIISHTAGAALFVFLTRNKVNQRNIKREKEKAQQELQKSEERFSTAFNLSPTPMMIRNVKDNIIVSVNNSFLHTYQWSPEDVLGKKITDQPFQIDKYNDFLNLLNENGSVCEFETHLHNHLGKVWSCLLSAAIVTINGESHILSSLIDISERQRLVEEVLRLDRLNMVGQMAASVAHEIRNPLTSVRGYLQLIKKQSKGNIDESRFDLMFNELDRTNSIISEYLLLAKNKVPDRKMHCLNNIITSVFPLLQTATGNSISAIELFLEDIPSLYLDENEIRQLLFNLINNGLEAMPTGGVLTIRTYQEANNIVLTISDQGHGIYPEILEKLGTPFLTTKDTGTGLGLPICYRIAFRHNATIQVESSPKGTTFWVRFKIPGNESSKE
ncbi:MAG: multi-sensor signal transduction histidine kinase [Firmicutes bacterium]|nr:multi-sensor signal transduction histidine kinase [Bacillota bacterium]